MVYAAALLLRCVRRAILVCATSSALGIPTPPLTLTIPICNVFSIRYRAMHACNALALSYIALAFRALCASIASFARTAFAFKILR